MGLQIYTPRPPSKKRWALSLAEDGGDLDLWAVDADTGERICRVAVISPSRGFGNIANVRDLLRNKGYDPLDGVDEDFWSKSLHGAIAIGGA